MNVKNISKLFFCFLLGASSYAQRTLSLKEAIEYSLANHKSTLIYANKVKIADHQKKDAISGYLPQVNGYFGLDGNLKRQTTVLPGAMFGRSEDIEVQMGTKFNSIASIQLDQTIYDQALIYGIKAGVPAKIIAELNREKNNEDLMYSAATAFFQILVLKEQQKLLSGNEKQYNDLYTISKFRFDKGVGKKVDVDRVLVTFNDIKTQHKQIQLDIDKSYGALKNAMGMSLDTPFVVEENLAYNKYLEFKNDTLNIQDLIGYKLQAQNIALQEIDVKRKRAAYLPIVSAYVKGGEQAFGNELGSTLETWRDYSAVGLKVNVPLFTGGHRDAKVQESRMELDNAKQNLDLSVAEFEMKFQNANKQVQEDIATLNSNKVNMELAKSVYETNKFEYDKGVALMSDLLDTDFTFRQAQSRYMSSLFNLVANRLIYERAKGTIGSFVNQL
jgi:outer membrane protein